LSAKTSSIIVSELNLPDRVGGWGWGMEIGYSGVESVGGDRDRRVWKDLGS